MKKINMFLALSLIIVSFLTGLTGGYFMSLDYRQVMYDKTEMGLGQADKFTDLRYLNQMASHHKAAILLAGQAEINSQRPEILNLAQNIQKEEPILIDELNQWKKVWYQDGRKFEEPQVSNLGQGDGNFDLRFLNALITHHEEGILMAKEIRTKSLRNEILDNADAVENFLTDSLLNLKSWRNEWYGVE